MEDVVFYTLAKIVNIRKYPSFPYDLYRYFNLLEDLKDEGQVNFDVIQNVQVADFSGLSFPQISEYNFSQSAAGTFQSRHMKRKLKFVDEEANEVALSLINRVTWPYNIQPNMESFITKNSLDIQLYIRDIPTMVCAIFVFLVLHHKKSDKSKSCVLKLLNKKILGKLGKKTGREKGRKRAPKGLGEKYMGKR